ncbi:MAG TPA: DUF4124 domain-containing protein [Steroidobacteraceae bacterium]
MSLACSLAVAATVYKWVDEKGVVHYSDQPHPNAQKMQVQAAQTYKASDNRPAAPGGAAPAPGGPAQAPSYQGCAIAEPADEQTFTNVDSLTVVVRTDPAIRPGDQVFLMLDGQPLNGGAPTGSPFVLTPVDRGTHTLQALVRSSDGGLMCQTPGVTFNVHQVSVLNPANPRHR